MTQEEDRRPGTEITKNRVIPAIRTWHPLIQPITYLLSQKYLTKVTYPVRSGKRYQPD
ncbi:hypothetical protein SAMN05444166_4049 [Singulisphaera sp. GP187]|nr:hypothetical protein SAMN05444166_4049 [Singulisphaera sp. GP187]